MIIDPYSWQRLAITDLSSASSDTISIRLTRPEGYVYHAGQYAIVRTNVDGAPLLRQYSFTSSPRDDFIELLIQREDEGVVSNWFFETARAGDEIELSQPLGSFTWNNEPGSILCIAGRVGIAPFVSMLRHHQQVSSRAPVTVVYSVREAEQICHKDLLDEFDTTYVVTSGGSRITKEYLLPTLARKPTVYACGSKQFVDAIHGFLRELDVPAENIRRELFTLQ